MNGPRGGGPALVGDGMTGLDEPDAPGGHQVTVLDRHHPSAMRSPSASSAAAAMAPEAFPAPTTRTRPRGGT